MTLFWDFICKLYIFSFKTSRVFQTIDLKIVKNLVNPPIFILLVYIFFCIPIMAIHISYNFFNFIIFQFKQRIRAALRSNEGQIQCSQIIKQVNILKNFIILVNQNEFSNSKKL